MSDQFLGEIRMFAGNFAPVGWAFCNGQLLPISQNTALFSLLGTNYGGDGRSTFGLPDLRDRTPMHPSSFHPLGEQNGSSTVTLTVAQLPPHQHAAACSAGPGTSSSPAGNGWAGGTGAGTPYGAPPPGAAMSAAALAPTGGGQPHNNRSPYLGLTFIIALQGIFPARQ